MKKTAIILAAIITLCSVCLAACNKKSDIPEGTMSFDDAMKQIETIDPKSELDKETLLTVGEVPVSAAAVRYANIASRQYNGATESIDEETLAAINQEIDEFYRLNSAIVLLSRKYNLWISEEDFDTNIKDYISQIKQMYGDQYETMVNQYTFQTPYFFAENMLLNIGYEKLFNHLFGAQGIAEEKQAVYDATLAQMKELDYVRAKHILIAFPDDIEKDEQGNVVNEAAKAETLARANEVLEKVNAGEDFDTLVTTYGEDPGMQTYPDGYFFTKGEMVQAFEETTYALEIGEVSGLVETPFGYHIILRLDIDDPALCENDIYLNNAYTALREMLVEISADYKIEYKENYQTRVDEFVSEYLDLMQAEAQAQAEYEAQQSDSPEAVG